MIMNLHLSYLSSESSSSMNMVDESNNGFVATEESALWKGECTVDRELKNAFLLKQMQVWNGLFWMFFLNGR